MAQVFEVPKTEEGATAPSIEDAQDIETLGEDEVQEEKNLPKLEGAFYEQALDSVLAAARRLMLHEPYYGFLLLSINKYISRKADTAWVCKNRIAVDLGVNPEFWESITPEQQEGVLTHELLHLAFCHVTRWRQLMEKCPELANIAMDIAVNQYIDKQHLIDGACTLEYFNKECGLSMKPFEGCRYYFDELYKDFEKKGKITKVLKNMKGRGRGQGEGEDGKGGDYTKSDKSGYEKKEFNPNATPNMPDHDFKDSTEEYDGQGDKALEATIGGMMKQAVARVGWGNTPGHIQQQIEELCPTRKADVDWASVFRSWTKSAESEDIRSTRRKLNKRNEQMPGFKEDPKLRMLAMVDTSGSVSDGMLKKFMDQLVWATKEKIAVDWLEFDHGIQHFEKFNPRRKVQIYGRGGTDFQAPLDWYKEHRRDYDAAVFFTDGGAPCPTSFGTAKLLWVIYSDGCGMDNIKEWCKDFPGTKLFVEDKGR